MFQSGSTDIMAVVEVSCKAIVIGQEFQNLGWWSRTRFQGKDNLITIIVTESCPTVSANVGGGYNHILEVLTTMKIQNYPWTQSWIDLNTHIAKLMDQEEQHILMGDYNSEASEVNTWMETQGLTNTICDLNRYSGDPIRNKKSKDFPIYGINCTAPLTVNRGRFPSFRRLVGDHWAL